MIGKGLFCAKTTPTITQKNTNNSTDGTDNCEAVFPSTSFSNSEVTETAQNSAVKLNTEYASEREVSKLKETLLKLIPNKITKSLASKLTMSLESALQKKQQINILHTFSHLLSAKDERLKKIHVQPTSISKRRFGMSSHGRARIPTGRPGKLKEKRMRNLALNIQKNQSNAKSHGSGH
jgi:hypothetical protein